MAFSSPEPVHFAANRHRTCPRGPMQRSDFRFWHPFRIRYSEIDGQMVVFNAHYLTFFDTAITEYLRHLAIDITADAKETGIDFHTVKSLVEYKAPVVFDQEIDV